MENREIFTQHYTSPLGGILLAADRVWADGPVVRWAKILWRASACGAHGAPDADSCPDQALAGPLFCREEAGFSAAAASGRLGVSPGGLGAFAADPLWQTTTYGALGQASLRRSWGGRGCLPRPSAGRWGTMKFRFSSRATGSSGRRQPDGLRRRY